MSEKIWNSFQSIGDDLILQADENAVRLHFTKKRMFFKKIIAACVLLVFSISLPLFMLQHKGYNEKFLDGNHDEKNDISLPPVLESVSTISCKLNFNKMTFSAVETPIILLHYEIPVDKDISSLEININTEHFTTPSPLKIDRIKKQDTIEIALIRNTDTATGVIILKVLFIDSKQQKVHKTYHIPYEITEQSTTFKQIIKKEN